MQQQPQKRLLSPLILFLSSARGKVFAKWCAYSGLGCVATCILLMDYSRLAILFLIPSPCLLIIGAASLPHRRITQVTLVLWVMLANTLLVTLPDLGNQASQQVLLQQQVIQLENQYDDLQGQLIALQKQRPLMQAQFDHLQNPSLSKSPLSLELDITQLDLSYFKGSQQYTNSLISYDISLIQNNNRNLPGAELISLNQQAIKDDNEQIQFNQKNDMSQLIDSNNQSLPLSEVVWFAPRIDQSGCVSGYTCLVQSSWQQPFVSGWQYITTEPLSATWFLWLSLLLALLGLFLLLPSSLSPRWLVSYQVMYTGLLSNLNDPGFPESKRQVLDAKTSIVKIEIRSSRAPKEQKDPGIQAQEFLRLKLGLSTTVSDVFLKQNAQQTTEELSEVYYDKATDNIILKLKPATPQVVVARQVRTWRTVKAVRYFPIQIYAVVDYFAGSMEVETPVAAIERLQERQGPRWLGEIATICHELVWWVYAAGCYIALMVCSYAFFRDATILPLSFSPIGLGLLIAGLVLKTGELIITKLTIKQQKTGSPGSPISLAY